MANVKISELDPGATLDGTETLPVVQGAATVSVSVDQILAPAVKEANSKSAKASGDANRLYTIPGRIVFGVTTGAYGIGTVYYEPFDVADPGGLLVNQIAVEISTAAAAGSLRLAVFAADDDWQPTGAALIASGELDVGTTGVKSFNTSTLLPPGRYVKASVCSSTATARVFTCGTFALSLVGSSNAAASNWRKTGSYGPLTGAAWDSPQYGATGFMHRVLVRPT